jgi:hypothetical protein
MKCKVLASLVVLTLLIPSSPILAVPRVPQLWNYTQQTVTFTVCGYSPKYRATICDDVIYKPGDYGELSCKVGTCTASVLVNGSRQKVRYTDGMGVTLDRRGLRSFEYTH